jgi:acetyl esterase/lipase
MLFPKFLAAMKQLIRVRRAMRGPLRPSWDEDFETWARFLHHYAKRSTGLPLAFQRKMLGVAPRSRVVRETRYENVRAGGVPAEWFHAKGSDPDRVLLYLHGGGYSLGSIESHRELVARLCVASGATGLAIDYRLAPEHKFPAQLDDARAAYRYVLDRGIDPARLVVAGESAGGGLTVSLLLSLREANEPLPAAAIVISPWIDLEATSESMRTNARYDYVDARTLRIFAQRFVEQGDLRNALAAPLYADLRGLPPMLIQAGGAETLLDDARRLEALARSAGVDATLDVEPDMIHVFQMFATFLPHAQAAIDRAGAFAKSKTPARDGVSSAQQLHELPAAHDFDPGFPDPQLS